MLPITAVPPTIATAMAEYRDLFCRSEGFDHVCRYVTGLVLSPNKTLQAIYDQQVWPAGERPSRRAMHEAVFAAGWNSPELMKHHRRVAASHYRGRGRSVIGVDWTLAHHERGEHIYGVKEAYDYVARRNCLFQTVVTAVIADQEMIDCVAVEVQAPNFEEQERDYLKETTKETYTQMDAVLKRVLELLHYQKNRLAYQKRTEIALEIVRQIEGEGQFPLADYAFDNGVLTVELTHLIEGCSKHWVSEVECSRNIQWRGEWKRVAEVDSELRTQHPESFRPVSVKCRNGETQQFWAFTKTVRLRKYGRKRLVIVHEREDLADEPRYLLTDALHWESGRVIQTWSYRWATEVFHEFSKQVTGLEAAQVRKEEAVKRHFRLSCVAQSILQRSPVSGGKSERYEFAGGKQTIGQKWRTIGREALRGLLQMVKQLFVQGQSCEQVLEVLMPG